MESFKGLLRSFVYAFRGIKYMFAKERNFRFHIAFMTYMFSILIFSDWFVISRLEYAVLVLVCGSVIAAEVFNTALENAVNLAKEEHSDYGRISKDTAAGAVLVNAIFAVITGFIIMYQPEAFRKMADYFIAKPLMLLVLALSLVPTAIFVLFGFNFKKGK